MNHSSPSHPRPKIALVLGTRPEAIKLAPLIRRLDASPCFTPLVIATAQHREMLDQVVSLFKIRVDYDLGIIQPRQTLAEITARAVTRLDEVLAKEKPDYLVVQGDTTTTFVGALAGYYHKIPVAHVEAGLRTRDKYQPFPEEMNRSLTTVLSDLHFAPTVASRDNLLAEGVDPGKIWVTGNTVVDALRDVLSWDGNFQHPVLDGARERGYRIVLVTSHRRENHGDPQRRICVALKELVRKYDDIVVVFPVHMSPAVRDVVMPELCGQERITLLQPMDYLETVHFMKASHLILTDSGGIQEEAPALGKPVLVLRETTERPEGVTAGTVQLVGTDDQAILSATSRLLDDPTAYRRMAEAVNPYGDGHACERILQILASETRISAAPLSRRAVEFQSIEYDKS